MVSWQQLVVHLSPMLSYSIVESTHHLNAPAAVTLSNFGETEAAKLQFDRFEALYGAMSKEVQSADADMVQQRRLLIDALHGT